MNFNIFKKKEDNFQMKKLKCPRCRKVMGKVEKEGVVLDVCSICRGMWLDDSEIEKLLIIQKGLKTKKPDQKAGRTKR